MTIEAKTKEYSLTITFERNGREKTKTFSFKTEVEMEAFRDGVFEMFGNDDYTIIGEENDD